MLKVLGLHKEETDGNHDWLRCGLMGSRLVQWM